MTKHVSQNFIFGTTNTGLPSGVASHEGSRVTCRRFFAGKKTKKLRHRNTVGELFVCSEIVVCDAA